MLPPVADMFEDEKLRAADLVREGARFSLSGKDLVNSLNPSSGSCSTVASDPHTVTRNTMEAVNQALSQYKLAAIALVRAYFWQV